MLLAIGAWLLFGLDDSFSQTPQATPTIFESATPNTYHIAWPGVAGRLYFIQVSTDLHTWIYAPFVELGIGQNIVWGFASTGEQTFVRLNYSIATDIVDGAMGDFDGDQIPNIDELGIGTDPLSIDTDGDGFTDGYEVEKSTSPTDENSKPQPVLRMWRLSRAVDYEFIEDSAPAVFEGTILTELDWLGGQPVETVVQRKDSDFLLNGWLETAPRKFPDLPELPNSEGAGSWLSGNQVAYGQGYRYASPPFVEDSLFYVETKVWMEKQPITYPILIIQDAEGTSFYQRSYPTRVGRYFRWTHAQTGPVPGTPGNITDSYSSDGISFLVEPKKQFSNPFIFRTDIEANAGVMDSEWVNLVPFKFEDPEPYSGLDNISPGLPWLMVPQGGENKVDAISGSAIPDLDLELQGPGQTSISVAPEMVDEGAEELTLTAGVVGELEYLAAEAGSFGGPYPLLRLAVYPHVEIEVTVHPIGRNSPGENPVPPFHSFTKEEIETYLNRIYEDQANVSFDVTVLPLVNVDWDLATEVEFSGYGSERLDERNKKLNVLSNGLTAISSEEQALLTASPPSTGIDVYFVNSGSEMEYHIIDPAKNSDLIIPISGVARTRQNEDHYVIVTDFETFPSTLLDTLAHELGHILIGSGHSDTSDYPCYIPGTDPTVRLMISGNASVVEKTHRTLLKCEWDKIHEWQENQGN